MWILLLMIAIMPFEANPYLLLADSFLGLFPRFTAIKLLGLAGLFWSGVQLISGRAHSRALDSTQSRAFLIFVVLALLASLFNGAGVSPLTRLMATVCLLPMVVVAVRGEKDLRTVLQVIALVIVGVFPYALRQMHRFGGRLGIGLYEANYYSLILVLLLPIPILLARESRGLQRLGWVLATGVVIIQISLTGSRGGFIAFLVTGLLLSVRLSERKILVLATACALGSAALWLVPNPMSQRLRASGLSGGVQDAGIAASNQERLKILRGGLQLVSDHPLTGVGVGNFAPVLAQYQGEDTGNIAHNTYLEIAGELGLPGLIAFCWVLWVTVRSLERSAILGRRLGDQRLRGTALALQSGLVGYFAGALFLSAQYEKFFWLVMFLSISVEQIARRKARAARRKAVEAAA